MAKLEVPKYFGTAHILIEKLPTGGRKLTHPAGVIVIETPEQLAGRRVELTEAVERAQQNLNRFDAAV